MIELRCPACKQSINLDESFVGRRVACVGCAKEFVVPDLDRLAAAGSPKRASAPAAPPPSRVRPASPATSIALPARPESTLLDKAKRHRGLVVGGLIVAVVGAAAAVLFSSLRGENSQDERLPVAVARGGGDAQARAAGDRDGSSSSSDGSGVKPPAGAGDSAARIESSAAGSATRPPSPATPPADEKKVDGTTNVASKPPAGGKPIAQQISSAKYVSAAGLLLRNSAELGDWLAVSRNAELPAGTLLALPAPFTARLDVGAQYVGQVLEGTVLRLLEPMDEMPFGFGLERGRLVVAGAGESDAPGAALSLAVGDEIWRVELLKGNTAFGVEILPRRPQRFEEDFGDDGYSGGILVAKGSLRLTDDAGRTRVIAGNSWLSLAKGDRVAITAASDGDSARQLPEPQYRPLPDWIDLDKLADEPAENAEPDSFEDAFNRQQQFGRAIEPLLAADDSRLVALAVRSQALLGLRQPLVQALATTKHVEVRQAAVDGLRDQMPGSKEGRERFKQELRDAFDKQADAVYALLWGYADEDVRDNQFTCFQLVSWLTAEELAIRELAWSEITAHATARYGYDHAATDRVRRRAAKSWQAHVLQNGTILGEEVR